MFHEFTLRKVTMMAMLAIAFVFLVGTFTYEEATNKIVERSTEYLLRHESNFVYALLYNPPWGSQPAAAEASQTGQAQSIPVLLYHGTPPEGNDNPPLPQNVFVDQMRALKADGWQTITLSQFNDFMKNGAPLPQKSFLLTFDDGRKESFYPVDPVLKELGYNAIMFVITGFSLPDGSTKSSSFYLDQTELQYMAASGRWQLESHGDLDHKLYDVPAISTTTGEVTTDKQQHFLSNKFWLEGPGREETDVEYTTRITSDLSTAKQKLENLTGQNITAYAFPFNDYGQEGGNFAGARDAIAQAVSSLYAYGFYQANPDKEDPLNYANPNAVMVKRIEPIASWSGADLVARLDNAEAKALPFTENTFEPGEWSNNWGNATVLNNILTLSATERTTGAAALLNGSELWQNYKIDAVVNWKVGDAVSLVGRYAGDSSKFFSCAFTDDQIILQMHNNGKISNDKSISYEPGDRSSLKLSMSLQGDTVSCTAGGVEASDTFDSTFNHPGSMGIQIWGPKLGDESIEVQSITASQR